MDLSAVYTKTTDGIHLGSGAKTLRAWRLKLRANVRRPRP